MLASTVTDRLLLHAEGYFVGQTRCCVDFYMAHVGVFYSFARGLLPTLTGRDNLFRVDITAGTSCLWRLNNSDLAQSRTTSQ